MGSIFTKPKTFTVVEENNSAYPASYLGIDELGIVFRSSDLTDCHITVQTDGEPIDIVALAGTNLPSGDAIRLRMGSSKEEVDGDEAAVDAVVLVGGGTPKKTGSLLYHTLDELQAYSFIRIDFESGSVSDSFFQASRLVVGQMVVADGVDVGAEITFGNATKNNLDPKRTKPIAKITVSGFTEQQFEETWYPFLMDVADMRGFLYIPDADSNYVQSQSMFGSMQTTAKSVRDNSDYNTIDMSIETII